MSTGTTSRPCTPPPLAESNPFPELFAGSGAALDEIPGHASTQQAPPTPLAARRSSSQLSKIATVAQVDSSVPSPTRLSSAPNAALLSPHSTTSRVSWSASGPKLRQREASTGRDSLGGNSSVDNAGIEGYRGRSDGNKQRKLVLERFSLYETKTVCISPHLSLFSGSFLSQFDPVVEVLHCRDESSRRSLSNPQDRSSRYFYRTSFDCFGKSRGRRSHRRSTVDH